MADRGSAGEAARRGGPFPVSCPDTRRRPRGCARCLHAIVRASLLALVFMSCLKGPLVPLVMCFAGSSLLISPPFSLASIAPPSSYPSCLSNRAQVTCFVACRLLLMFACSLAARFMSRLQGAAGYVFHCSGATQRECEKSSPQCSRATRKGAGRRRGRHALISCARSS